MDFSLTEPFPFLELPSYCQELILDYLYPSELLKFREVNSSQNSWIKQNLKQLCLSRSHVKECLDLFPNLQELTLNITSEPDNLTLKNYPNLNKLKIIGFVPSSNFLNDNMLQTITWEGQRHNSNVCLYDLLDHIAGNLMINTLKLINKTGWCERCLPLYSQMIFLKNFKMISSQIMSFQQILNLTALNLTHIFLIDCYINPHLSTQPDLINLFNRMNYLEKLEISENMLSEEQLSEFKTCKFKTIPVPSKIQTNHLDFLDDEYDDDTDLDPENLGNTEELDTSTTEDLTIDLSDL